MTRAGRRDALAGGAGAGRSALSALQPATRGGPPAVITLPHVIGRQIETVER